MVGMVTPFQHPPWHSIWWSISKFIINSTHQTDFTVGGTPTKCPVAINNCTPPDRRYGRREPRKIHNQLYPARPTLRSAGTQEKKMKKKEGKHNCPPDRPYGRRVPNKPCPQDRLRSVGTPTIWPEQGRTPTLQTDFTVGDLTTISSFERRARGH